jgi:hypothetical protein
MTEVEDRALLGSLLLAHHEAVVRRNWAEHGLKSLTESLAVIGAALSSGDIPRMQAALAAHPSYLQTAIPAISEAIDKLHSARAAVRTAFNEASSCGVTPLL